MSIQYPDLPYTNMPDDEDDLIVYSNVDSDNINLVNQYQSLLDQGKITEANKFYIDNESVLKTVIINENTMNRLTQAVIALERFYLNDLHNYMDSIARNYNLIRIEVVDELPPDAASHPDRMYAVCEK